MFDLEKAIRKWRKNMVRNQAMEDGYIEELESHLRDEIEVMKKNGLSPENAFEQAVNQLGRSTDIGAEYFKTDSRGPIGSPPWRTGRFSLGLTANYLKIAFRKLRHHKGYSFVNMAGLAVGIACCLFIILFVRFETSYDRHHPHSDRLYFVGLAETSEAQKSYSMGNMPLMAPTIKARFPQVEAAGRYINDWISQVRYQDKIFKEDGIWSADPGIFELLGFRFIQGDPKTALEQPHTAVITQDIALKYFGDENPIDKFIKIGDEEFAVSGILENPPLNSIFQFKIIKSWKTLEDQEMFNSWRAGVSAIITLVRIRPDSTAKDFEKSISLLPQEYCGEQLEEMGQEYQNFLMLVKDRHLVSIGGGKFGPSTSQIYIYIFSTAGLLILLIACMNYMNLATARSANRAREVGLRKVIGAQRHRLISQFLGESLILVFLSTLLAVGLVELLLSKFNRLAGTEYSAACILRPDILLGLTTLILIVGVISGFYPALVLSSFKPLAILRGAFQSGTRGVAMRKVLVVTQFSISITLVISTLIIFRQISFMKNQSLGFDKNQKVVLTLKNWRMIQENYEAVKNEFLAHPSVLNASANSGVPGSKINQTWVFPQGEQETMGRAFRSLRCDHDFPKVFGLHLVAGRHFNKELESDTYEAFILNETGVKAFGWASPDEALGKRLWDEGYPIIGVVKDFHWWGLQREIEPMIMRVVPDLFRSITLTVDTQNLPGTLAFIEKTYAGLFPGDLFECFFLDTNFDLQYSAEERIGRIFRIFTGLGIFIACLGLFGLASFIAEQRTKEIGIRKVLGASVPGLVFLLSKEFSKWVLVSNLLAWPLAYYASRVWLQEFAYRTNTPWELFIISTGLAFSIALITVGYQAVKTATSNPVNSLRYE